MVFPQGCWDLLIIGNKSNEVIALNDRPPCLLLNRIWNNLRKGCFPRSSLAISRRLFSLEIGWPQGPWDQSLRNQEGYK